MLVGLLSIAQLAAQATDVDKPSSPTRFINSLRFFAGPSYLFPETVRNYPGEKRQIKFGFSAGLSLSHRFNNWFDVEGILSFQRNGSTTSLAVYDNLTITENISNDYITLSIVPTAVFFGDRLNVGIGGYFGTLIKSQLKVTFDSLNAVSYGYLKDASGNFRDFDGGIIVTSTYNAKLLGRNTFIRLVGNFGIASVNWISDPNFVLFSAIRRNNAIALCIGLQMTRSR